MTLQEQKEIIQAAIDGKELEYRFRLGSETKWATIGPKYTLFNFDIYEYRVKREPREGWIWYPGGDIIGFSTKEALLAAIPAGGKILHVREIFD